MTDWTKTAQLGTELEIVSHQDLQRLLAAIRARVEVIRDSRDGDLHTLWVELVVPAEADLDETVCLYVDLIESLPTEARTLWDTALDRCLNTGVQAGVEPHAFPVKLSAATIARASRIAVRHQVTVYAAHRERSPVGPSARNSNAPRRLR